MFSQATPYQVTGAVEDPRFFIGRHDVVAWVWERGEAGNHILLIEGSPRIGKSSLLRQIEREAPGDFVPLYVDLLAVRGHTSGPLIHHIVHQFHRHLLAEVSEEPVSVSASMPSSVWRALRDLIPTKTPIWLLDDLDRLLAAGDETGWALVENLAEMLALHPDLMVICTCRSKAQLGRVKQLPFADVPTFTLGALTREEAYHLIKVTQDALELDYEAIERIDELTGRHPYFIQLLCGQIYEQKSVAGRAGIVDIQPAVQALTFKTIPPFEEAWACASSEGKILMSLLGSMKGAYEVITLPEVTRSMRKAGIPTDASAVTNELEKLVDAGSLIQLGAGSYRFFVQLYRYWLRIRHPLSDTRQHNHWNPRRRTGMPQRDGGAASTSQRAAKITLAVLVPMLTLAIALSFVLFPDRIEESPPIGVTQTPGLATLAALLTTPQFTPRPDLAASDPVSTALAPTFPPPWSLSPEVYAIAYTKRALREPWQIWMIDIEGGAAFSLTDGAAEYTAPAWSPEGMRLAFVSERDGSRDIFSLALETMQLANLTDHPEDDGTPAWSPDGTEIAFSSMRDGDWEIYVMWADGAAPMRLTDHPEADISPTWSPDGRQIAFASKRDGPWNIYVMDRDGSNVRRLTNSAANDMAPAWSPQDGYIAFESNQSGSRDIFIMHPDGSGLVNVTNSRRSNDQTPSWAASGNELAFSSNREGEWDIYVLALDQLDGPDAVGPRRLTDGEGSSLEPAWRPLQIVTGR